MKILRHTLNNKEIAVFIDKIKSDNLSMIPEIRLQKLSEWCLRHKNSEGSFVECGVAKGGCLALMKYLSGNNKSIWGFDSFEGLPEQTVEDEEDGKEWVGHNCSEKGMGFVQETFEKLNLNKKNVNIIKGYFKDTLLKHKPKIGRIAILRLDSDWYMSTKTCLETLYENVIEGGVILIDDYGTFKGCRKAVDEFRTKNKIISSLRKTDEHEHYWIKNNQKIKIKYRKNTSDEFIIKEIFENNEYLLDKLNLSENPVIVDIGAHIGCFTIIAKKTFPNAKIIAFEPETKNFQLLKKNIKFNKLKNVKIYRLAITKNKGKRKLHLNPKNTAAHTLKLELEKNYDIKKPKEKYETVKCTTLEKIFKKHKIKKIDLLKLDCEGAEFEILYTLPEKYFQKIQNITLEYHDDLQPPNTSTHLKKFLTNKNYKITHEKKYNFKEIRGIIRLTKK
jgi:FkbM family methyltransferase